MVFPRKKKKEEEEGGRRWKNPHLASSRRNAPTCLTVLVSISQVGTVQVRKCQVETGEIKSGLVKSGQKRSSHLSPDRSNELGAEPIKL